MIFRLYELHHACSGDQVGRVTRHDMTYPSIIDAQMAAVGLGLGANYAIEIEITTPPPKDTVLINH